MVSSIAIYSLFAAALVPFVAAHPSEINTRPSNTSYFAILVKKSTGNNIFTLSCNPDGGSHLQPQQACQFLQSVNGNINNAPPNNVICTLEYNPVNVLALGIYQGRPTYFNKQYSNECQAIGALGALYPHVA